MADESLIKGNDAVEVDKALLAQVQEVVNTLTKTSKVFRTYPRANTISITAIDSLTKTFGDYLNQQESLELFVNRHELQWQGVTVYSESDQRKSFALKLDRDGVRRLMFTKGITRDEVLGLLEALTREVDEESLDDDVVTLLWEKQLEHVKVFVLDDLASGEEGFDQGMVGSGEKGTDAPEQGASMGSSSVPSPASASEEAAIDRTVQPAMCTATKAKLHPITDEQAVLLKDVTEKEESHDVSDDLTDILFDILQSETQQEIYGNACKVLLEISMMHMRGAGFGAAAEVLDRMRALAADDNANKEVRSRVVEQLQSLADHSRVESIIGTVKNHENISKSELAQYLAALPAAAAPELCELLEIERYDEVVRLAIKHLIKDDPKVLAPKIAGTNVALAGKVLAILEQLADASLVQALADPLSAADDSVKLASVKLLGTVKGPVAREILLGYVTSSNPALRKAALRTLGTFADEPAVAELLRSEVLSGEFEGRTLDEKKTLFLTLAKLESHLAVRFLEGILAQKKWFEKPPHAETRACAALALGEIDDDAAREVLERNASEKSEAVGAAIRIALSRRSIAAAGR